MTWTVVADAADVPSHGLMGVEVDGIPLLLAQADGQLYAYHDRCLHLGVKLSIGRLDGRHIVCGFHQ